MSAHALPAPRLGRFATWFGGATSASTPRSPSAIAEAAEADTRLLVDRRLYDDIGDFLFAHRLPPSPVNFEIAHAYLSGCDPMIAGTIVAMLADGGTLDPDRLATLIADTRGGATGAGALAALAGQLEARLAECLSAADRTHSSARTYGDALDIAQTRLDTDPTGTLEHIAGLTREVVSTTRLVESELNHTRREAERLRCDLDRAREAAERDHLTGLPNRRGFERRVTESLSSTARPTAQRAAIALCDIDDFKRVNDIHGHQAGDRVLKFVGTFLTDELGAGAYVARHGGEEFAVLIEGHSAQEASLLLDDVRQRLAARSLVNQETGLSIGRITFSAGVATLDRDTAGALGAADAALYQAKNGGKNAVTVASTGAVRRQANDGGGGRPSR